MNSAHEINPAATADPDPPATLTVGDLMTRGAVSVAADAPLPTAVQLLDEHGISGLAVVDATGRLVGVLSRTDLVRAQATEHLWRSWPGLAVRHLMTSVPITAPPTLGLTAAARLMESNHIHRLIVVDEDGTTPIGVISTTDLVRAMALGLGESDDA